MKNKFLCNILQNNFKFTQIKLSEMESGWCIKEKVCNNKTKSINSTIALLKYRHFYES